jgi:hypothetical protein
MKVLIGEPAFATIVVGISMIVSLTSGPFWQVFVIGLAALHALLFAGGLVSALSDRRAARR